MNPIKDVATIRNVEHERNIVPQVAEAIELGLDRNLTKLVQVQRILLEAFVSSLLQYHSYKDRFEVGTYFDAQWVAPRDLFRPLRGEPVAWKKCFLALFFLNGRNLEDERQVASVSLKGRKGRCDGHRSKLLDVDGILFEPADS